MLARLAIATIAVFAFSVTGAAQDIKLDKEKSKIEFVGKKTDGKHSGGFKEFTADCKVNWEAPEKSTLVIDIKAASLFSDNKGLTDHLKNPDFFNVDKFPTIKFESTKIQPSETEPKITGKMTMLGKTVEIDIPTKVEVTDTDLIIKTEFKLDRTKWGMNNGRPKISDEVEITATLHYKR